MIDVKALARRLAAQSGQEVFTHNMDATGITSTGTNGTVKFEAAPVCQDGTPCEHYANQKKYNVVMKVTGESFVAEYAGSGQFYIQSPMGGVDVFMQDQLDLIGLA